MHVRLSNDFLRIEEKYKNPLSFDKIYNQLKNFSKIIPQGGPMSGIGNDFQLTSIANCFVIGNTADSYGGILQMEHDMIQLMKRRGGVGIDLSHIRPENSKVNNAAITSTGIVPFMERFSNGTREVAQGGRRGALMLTIDIRHPDAEKFISAKLDLNKVTGANISPKITDDFMEAVKSKTPFIQQYPVNSDTPIIRNEINPLKLWKKIVHNAWKSGEPGLLLWDRIIEESPADCYIDYGFETISTNPCGELPLCYGDSCRLLCINLFSFVKNPFTSDSYFDFASFIETIRIAQRLMDDMIDIEEEKVNQILHKIETIDSEDGEIKRGEVALWNTIKEKLIKGRRTGLGVTAEADMLAALNITYGTPTATEFCEAIHQTLAVEALQASIELAKERGHFPVWNYELEKNNPFLKRVLENLTDDEIKDYKRYGRRNISMLTIAPTGTTSLMSQTSSGIEPVFSIEYTRRRKINPNDNSAKTQYIDEMGDHWEEYRVVHPKFAMWAELNGHRNLDTMKKSDFDQIVRESPYYKSTANEIDWKEKVTMQGRIQKWIDHSISMTLNLPEHVSESVVEEVLFEAWLAGCKGITVYKDKCRSGVLVNQTENKINIFKENHAPKREKVLNCDIMRFVNKGEKWVGFLGLLDNKPYEIFTGPVNLVPIPIHITSAEIHKNKTTDGNFYDLVWHDNGEKFKFEKLCTAFNREYWNIGRLVSAILRHGMPLPNVIQVIDKLEIDGSNEISNWKHGVKRMLKKYIQDGTKIHGTSCPECESCNICFKDGCEQCADCGWTKCS